MGVSRKISVPRGTRKPSRRSVERTGRRRILAFVNKRCPDVPLCAFTKVA
jgi:hypothetical protein